MGKLLVLVLVVLVAYAFVKALAAKGRASGAAPRQHTGERMVPCSQCGINLPESEALAAGERYFCCDEHRRQFRQ
ncbi:MAG: hypothetical protein LJE97_17425 [Betaproteobacteria bacterium]|jgi:uncharacterized protein|nr:hypothetical protein [Betaproteobacteria bacterium]